MNWSVATKGRKSGANRRPALFSPPAELKQTFFEKLQPELPVRTEPSECRMMDGSIRMISPEIPIRDEPIPLSVVRKTLPEILEKVSNFKNLVNDETESGYGSRSTSTNSNIELNNRQSPTIEQLFANFRTKQIIELQQRQLYESLEREIQNSKARAMTRNVLPNSLPLATTSLIQQLHISYGLFRPISRRRHPGIQMCEDLLREGPDDCDPLMPPRRAEFNPPPFPTPEELAQLAEKKANTCSNTKRRSNKRSSRAIAIELFG